MSFSVGTVDLRNPVFGNTISLQRNSIQRYTRGGDFKYYNHTDWPQVEIHQYTFERIQKSVMNALKTFIATNAGTVVAIDDHFGDTYNAYILGTVTIVSVRPDCSYDISLVLRKA